MSNAVATTPAMMMMMMMGPVFDTLVFSSLGSNEPFEFESPFHGEFPSQNVKKYGIFRLTILYKNETS